MTHTIPRRPIKLDDEVNGQDIDGFRVLNFNNTFGDPTYLREVLYSNLASRHVPEAGANFINVYVNDEFYGVYANIQQLDEDYIDQWYMSKAATNFRAEGPEDEELDADEIGPGTQSLNYLGEDLEDYEKAYDIKTTDSDEPYTPLIDGIRALDRVTAENVRELDTILDIDGSLWFLARLSQLAAKIKYFRVSCASK